MSRYDEGDDYLDGEDCNHEDDGEGTCLGCGKQMKPRPARSSNDTQGKQ